eukprot:611600-Pleurochrysis_carterae.AAC.3
MERHLPAHLTVSSSASISVPEQHPNRTRQVRTMVDPTADGISGHRSILDYPPLIYLALLS